MKSEILKLAAFAASIMTCGSAPGSPREIVSGTPRAASIFNERFDAVNAEASFAWGEHTMGRLVDTQAMFIRHTATKLQRQIAEQNAKAYVAQLTPEKKLQLKKKKIRYLAVPTVRSNETSPETKEVIMIWDVPRESLVGKNAYELSATPPIGKLASYDNLVAEYVGKAAKDF